MPQLTMGIGFVLTVIGIAGYLLTGGASLTALAPALLGGLLVALGAAAMKDPWRKHAMHVASLLALLGLLGSGRGLLALPRYLAGDAQEGIAPLAESATALLLLIYLTFAVRSFIQARRKRTGAA